MFKKNKSSYETIIADIKRDIEYKREKVEEIKAGVYNYRCTGKWIAYNINKNSFSKYIRLSYFYWNETLISVTVQADFIKDDVFNQINDGTPISCCLNDLLEKAAIEGFECDIHGNGIKEKK